MSPASPVERDSTVNIMGLILMMDHHHRHLIFQKSFQGIPAGNYPPVEPVNDGPIWPDNQGKTKAITQDGLFQELKGGKTVKEIGKQLGMRPEEVFRLTKMDREAFLDIMLKGEKTPSRARKITNTRQTS